MTCSAPPRRLFFTGLALAILASVPPAWALRGTAGEGEGLEGEGLLTVADAGEAGLAGPGDGYNPDGVGVELLDPKNEGKLVTSIPATVKVVIHGRRLETEYMALVKALSQAPKGRMHTWKASALYRTMYVGGHEAAFRAKDVSIYLTKESTGDLLDYSVLKLWFVDRTVEKLFVPEHVYRDGMIALPLSRLYTAHFYNLSKKGEVPLAAAAQLYDGFVSDDKSSMPVDVLKLVESKGPDAIHYLMNLAARIEIGDGSSFDAAWTIATHRLWMMQAGLDIYFVQKKTRVQCNNNVKTKLNALVAKIPGVKRKEEECFETVERIEYYDMDLVDKSYRPRYRYPNDRIVVHQFCQLPDASRKAGFSLRPYADKYLKDTFVMSSAWSSSKSEKCRQKVAGSMPREKEEGCKCPGDNMVVFCGPSQVAGRKFGLEDTLEEVCAKGSEGELYCAEQACRMPNW